MDMTGNDTNVVPPKGTEEMVHYHAPNMCSDWHVTGNNPMVESSSSSPMLNSFCPLIWDHPNITGTNWTPNGALRENMFLSSVPAPHFPAGSGSVGQAVGFSCFDGGHFSRIVNPFGVIDPLDHNSHLGLMQKPNEAIVGNELRTSIREVSTENFTRPNNVVKNGVDVLGAQSDHEAEFSGGREEFDGTGGDLFRKEIGLKKRKRTEQVDEKKTVNNENNESQEPADEFKEKGDQNPSPTGNPDGKGSDPPKEEYIHVRARRGQATNSHSLAERIRREKISDRMKFLQDLVPGCSKLTGKAVMLDEIINYVQSLQRQVEFLSMKLATVNPRLDFNLLEGFLAKDAPGVWGDDELHNVVHNGFNLTAPLNISDLSVCSDLIPVSQSHQFVRCHIYKYRDVKRNSGDFEDDSVKQILSWERNESKKSWERNVRLMQDYNGDGVIFESCWRRDIPEQFIISRAGSEDGFRAVNQHNKR
ncbi:hypothetical protein OROGR_010232 [Orobanche gracilis]